MPKTYEELEEFIIGAVSHAIEEDMAFKVDGQMNHISEMGRMTMGASLILTQVFTDEEYKKFTDDNRALVTALLLLVKTVEGMAQQMVEQNIGFAEVVGKGKKKDINEMMYG